VQLNASGMAHESNRAVDDVLEPIFRAFSKKMGVPLIERKRDFHKLVHLMNPDSVHPEIITKLNLICEVANGSIQGSGFV